jgi:hypothetical protein
MVMVGPLADLYFEPAMAATGNLAPTFGWLVGTGPGAGMALMILFSGLIAAAVALVGYSIKKVRDVERIIPDVDPNSQLLRYKRKLDRRFRNGELTKEQCREMTETEKTRLGL